MRQLVRVWGELNNFDNISLLSVAAGLIKWICSTSEFISKSAELFTNLSEKERTCIHRF